MSECERDCLNCVEKFLTQLSMSVVPFLAALWMMFYMLYGFYSYNDLNIIPLVISFFAILFLVWWVMFEDGGFNGAGCCWFFIVMFVNPMFFLLIAEPKYETYSLFASLPDDVDSKFVILEPPKFLANVTVLAIEETVEERFGVKEHKIIRFGIAENDVVGEPEGCFKVLEDYNILVEMEDCEFVDDGEIVVYEEDFSDIDDFASTEGSIINRNGKSFVKAKIMTLEKFNDIRARLMPIAVYCALSTVVFMVTFCFC
jgi:hypothetical protein